MKCEHEGCKFVATHWVEYKDQPGHRFLYCYGHYKAFQDVSGVFAPGLNGGRMT